MALTDPARLGVSRACSNQCYGRTVFGLLAYWYDFLYYGRGLTLVVIVAISSIVRIVKRGRTSSSTQQQFQQQYPQQQPGYPQPYPPQPYPPQQYPPQQQPFGAPSPLDAPFERPRSTPLPGIFGSDPPPPPPR